MFARRRGGTRPGRCRIPRRAWPERNDLMYTQPLSVGLAVVSTICQHDPGFAHGVARLIRHQRHLLHQCPESGHVVAVGWRGARGQRAAIAVRQEVILGALSASVRGRFAGFVPAAQGPQRCGVCRRPAPVDPVSLASRTACRPFHTPSLCHSCRRTQHAAPEPQPISRGRSFQGRPVLRIKRIPVNAARFSWGLRPG